MIAPKTFAFALVRGVATITLDREARLNALTFESYQELAETFERIHDDDDDPRRGHHRGRTAASARAATRTTSSSTCSAGTRRCASRSRARPVA